MEREANSTEAEQHIRAIVALVEVHGGPTMAAFIRRSLQRSYPAAYVAVMVEEHALVLLDRLLAMPGELDDLSRAFRGVDIYTLAALSRLVAERLLSSRDRGTLEKVASAVVRRQQMLGRPDDE